jgi:hypothetical protein
MAARAPRIVGVDGKIPERLEGESDIGALALGEAKADMSETQ